jgi:LysR family transcriptional regulator, transcriptional activator of the cysJI operon
MPMDDHRLKAFCFVVEMRSFSKAADAKFITQSAMSHLIKNLEDELGVRLFNRKAKKVVVTPAGRIFYGHAKKILECYKTMENEIQQVAGGVKGNLSIGASATAATYLLPQVFYDFSRTYPEVRLNLSVSNTESLMTDLYDGKIELAITEGSGKSWNMNAEEIADDEIVLIASDDNPLTKKKRLNHHDLLSQPFIMPEAGSDAREIIDKFMREMRIDLQKLKIIMTLGDPELLVEMVEAGLGISFVSKWTIFKKMREETIRILTIPGRRLYRKFYLVSLDEKSLTMAGSTFGNFVKGYRFFVPI